jgi:hypothetical protein
MKVGVWNYRFLCLSAPPPPITFECLKLSMYSYVMAPLNWQISLINLCVCAFLLSFLGNGSVDTLQRQGIKRDDRTVGCLCLCVFVSPIVARQHLGKGVPAATTNCWRHRLLCCLRVISEESRQFCCPYISLPRKRLHPERFSLSLRK